REGQGILDCYLSNAVSLLIKQRQHQTEELGAFLLPRDTYAKFSKAFQIGEWGGFYRIYSNFPIATKDPKTNLSSIKSQQKQEVQMQKKPVYTSFFMLHFMQDKTILRCNRLILYQIWR
ncbi:hypothetical protein PD335_003548, partial [Salmonella enterica]|nr:hypothetical protein [Salmonella enterica]EHM1182424.1 hypothetical protein [Salmonella enterica subsp. enterica serovar Lattenkamp]EHA4003811.1 hypothetical protein [Salmonella enterica]EHA6233350.1 hypothetical protein [Salmonella enterica]EHJ0186116.1 hypothetical protein [Salmonella enterica]